MAGLENSQIVNNQASAIRWLSVSERTTDNEPEVSSSLEKSDSIGQSPLTSPQNWNVTSTYPNKNHVSDRHYGRYFILGVYNKYSTVQSNTIDDTTIN